MDIKTFENNLDGALKQRIIAAAAKRIEDLVNKAQFTINDIGTLVGASHGAVKARADKIADAAGIIDAVLSGVRSSSKKTINPESVKSFIDSMSPEEREKFLAELNHG